MSVSSLASEGFLYYRRPRAEFLFTRALAMDSLGSSSNMIGVDSSSEEPPLSLLRNTIRQVTGKA